MASEDAIVAQRLECSLCFELMQESKLLSCTHTFCKDCLAKLYQCQRKTDQISCPMCRQTTKLQNGDVSRLQTNVPIKAMIGDVQSAKRNCTVCDPETKSTATAYCQMCVDYMCESCTEAQGKFRKNKDHEVCSVDDINKGKVKRFCRDHPEEEKLRVCTTCNCLICFRCRMLKHNDSYHKLVDVPEFQNRMKVQIESLKKEAGEKVKSFERHMKLTKEQDTKIELKIDAIIADIDKAYNDSIQQLTKRRNTLKEQCHELKNKLKMQLSDINRISKNEMDCIISASDLVSNGRKTILEGETLAVHTALCNELEDMLGRDGPDDTKPTAITKQAEDVEFTRYRGEKELDLGHVMRKTMWELEKVYEYPLSGSGGAWDVHPTQDGGAAVGYGSSSEGIELFTDDGLQKAVLKESGIVRFCLMSNGHYVVLDINKVIKLYTPDWKLLPVKFNTHVYDATNGLCVDKYDNIFVGNDEDKITVFGPEGGAPIREIPCNDFEPIYIQHMHHSKLLVVNDTYYVRVIDENGTVKCDINKDGYNACFTVLQDDNILIAWRKARKLTIDLYTQDLTCIRTVLDTFKGDFSSWCLTELTTGAIALTDHSNLYVFQKF